MNPDLALVLGILFCLGAFPALLNSFSTSGRTFRLPVALVVVGVGMIAWASTLHQGGYAMDDIPKAFGNVLQSVLGA